MRRQLRALTVALAVLVLAAYATSCSTSPTQQQPKPAEKPQEKPKVIQEIKIGILEPLSGPLAPLGQSELNGHKFAAEEINAAGGIKSLGGAQIRLVIADTRGEPQVGMAETERLITQEKVALIAGAYQSSVTYPTTDVAEKYGIPYVVPGAVMDDITDRGLKTVFRVAPKGSAYGRDMIFFLRDMGNKTGNPIKTVAVAYENTDYGRSVAEGAKKYAKEVGFEVTLDEPYPAGATDLTPVVLKLKKAAPDAVIFVSYVSDAILLTNTIASQAFRAKALVGGGGGYIDPSYLPSVKANAEGWFILTEWNNDLGKPLAKEKNDAFKAKYGADMGPSAQTYAATYVIADALERAASISADALLKALRETKLTSGPALILPCEKIEFDEKGQNKYATLIITQVQDGKYVTVWPFHAAAGDAKWPMPVK